MLFREQVIDSVFIASKLASLYASQLRRLWTTCDFFPVPPSQVNGKAVVGMQHSEVVAAIKAGGDETSMLVVDEETDEFFRRCHVLPTEEHLSGKKLRDHVRETVLAKYQKLGRVGPLQSASAAQSS